jgi:hypothetical protein
MAGPPGRLFNRFAHFSTCDAVLAEACARLAYYHAQPVRVVELVKEADRLIRFGCV